MKDDLFSLAGKTCVVTGAVGLLGKQHCRALAAHGARVVVADLDEAKCRAFASDLPRAIGVALDVTKKESLAKLVAEIGAVDVLVNNAAINDTFEGPHAGDLSRFENYPLELFERSLRVNVTGVFLASQVVGTEMKKRGRGSIVNIASTYGVVAPDQSIYAKPNGAQTFFKSASYPTTKGAVLAFTRFLAAYWGKDGVRVNAISPGGVENGQDDTFIANYSKRTPLGRMAKPTELAGALVFLASDASSYVTGANLVVDGGFTAW